MKKKKLSKNGKITIMAIGIIGVIISKVIVSNISLALWENSVYDYLDRRYEGKYEITSINKNEGEVVCHVITKDDNQIEFTVSCWWDGTYTPWGEIFLYPERHFLDTLSESINYHVVGEYKVFDITGKTMDEIFELIYEYDAVAQQLYELYDIVGCPRVRYRLCYNTTIAEYLYMSTLTNPYSLAEAIYEDLIEPNLEAEE